MNFKCWLREATNILSTSESPNKDARILLEFVTGKTQTFMMSFGDTLFLLPEQKISLNMLLFRRKAGEPIAYLIGEHEFWSLPLYVSTATLIPRPDTECLVEKALSCQCSKYSRVLDLGTGTGAIALALASERPNWKIVAIDLILDVVNLAKRNVKRLSIHNVKILQSYWFDVVKGQKFDMIISNPPYIDINDPHLLQGDVQFEPSTALVASNKGMANLDYIILHSRKYLTLGGWLLVEHGWTQGKNVRERFIQSGYTHVETCLDYNRNERLTLGKIA